LEFYFKANVADLKFNIISNAIERNENEMGEILRNDFRLAELPEDKPKYEEEVI
jgi:hypothetical protein